MYVNIEIMLYLKIFQDIATYQSRQGTLNAFHIIYVLHDITQTKHSSLTIVYVTMTKYVCGKIQTNI